MIRFTKLVAIAAAVTAGAASAETYGSGAIGFGTSGNVIMPMSESHVVMHVEGMYERFEVAAGHPLEGATGSCFGAIEIKVGQVSGTGNCVYDTAAGEKAVMSWIAMDLSDTGVLMGEWSVSGGTGAWASASGGGTFSSLTDPATGKFVNTISGDITIE